MLKLRIILVGLGLGGLLFFWGLNEFKLSSNSSPTPQAMSCLELVTYGEGDNAHVTLSEFWYDLENTVVESPENNENHFKKAYIPLHPINGEPGTIILRSDDLPDIASLERMARRSEVQGMVINSISKLGREEQKLLRTVMRPGEEPIILDLDRKPKAAGTAIGMMFGGGCVMLLPLLGLVIAGRGSVSEYSDDGMPEADTPAWSPTPTETTSPSEGRLHF